MKLNVKSLALTSSFFCGGTVLFICLMNLAWPPYGQHLLDFCNSIYPGFHGNELSFSNILIGVGYALLDGALGGGLFAIVYNKLTPSS